MAEEDVTRTGGCLCGAIRYEVHGKPRFVVQCYCRDCQLATGTGHTTIVGVSKEKLSVDGSPKIYINQGESGLDVYRHFCGNCGSRLYTAGDRDPAIYMIQSGTLDDPSSIAPTAAVHLRNRQRWDVVDSRIQHFDHVPEPDLLKKMIEGRA